MGQMTLSRFRAHVMANPALQGLPNVDADLVTDWVNMAYFEVTGAIEFEALEKCAAMTTVNGVAEYALPVRFVAMTAVQDRTTGVKIVKSTLRNMLRYTWDTVGYPRFWARTAAGIKIWPIPDSIYSFFVYYTSEPVRLQNANDVTVLPATWDKAILLMAIETALRNFNQFDPADKLFTRAMAHMRSRMKDEDLGETEEGPLNLVRSWEELTGNRPDSNAAGWP